MTKTIKHKIIVPSTNEELEKYYHLRYEILRKRWGQEETTTRDEYENESLHIMAIDEEGNAIATGRLQFNKNNEAQVRSMAVIDEQQKTGLGSELLQYLENEARKRNFTRIVLDARDNAVDFYIKNGYEVEGDSYVLFGVIPHFKMSKSLL